VSELSALVAFSLLALTWVALRDMDGKRRRPR
jgi:hypothetical protein